MDQWKSTDLSHLEAAFLRWLEEGFRMDQKVYSLSRGNRASTAQCGEDMSVFLGRIGCRSSRKINMQIDLKADALRYIVDELQTLGVQPPSSDLTECALLLFKLERRCPEPRPRQTKLSATFTVPDELSRGLELLRKAIHRGDNLKPYLSRETFKVEQSDGLLDDWGILHLHLGERLQSDGLIKGTKVVAFVLVRDDCIYFIEALPHGYGHGDVWFRESLIHVIDQNWPELLPSNGSPMTADVISPQERRAFRKKLNVNVTVAKPSGEVIFAPGGGVMADGTAMADFSRLQRLYADLDYLERLCRHSEAEIRAALGKVDGDVSLCGRVVSGQMKVYEVSSGTEVRLSVP